MHGAVLNVVGVHTRRQQPAAAQARALKHRLGAAREGVVETLGPPNALVVLARRELDDEAEPLLDSAPEVVGS